MSWDKYYEQEITIPGLLSNLYGQKEFLAEIISRAKGRVLEVGTGTGGMSVFLAWLGLDITSIDTNPKVIEVAKQTAEKLNARVVFKVADTFALPYPNQSFDVLFHQGLLEHFKDQDIHKILGEQLRVAKQVVISVPNHRYPRRDFGNERLMDKNKWEKILDRYKLLASTYYSPKIFPKPYLPKSTIQYMAVIEKK